MMNVYLAELIGTMILVLLGDGAVANVVLKKSKAENSGWIVITAGWSFAVAMAVYAVGRVSGGHINPAVTIALASIGEFSWSLVPGYILAQILGGIMGAILVWLAFLPHWEVTDDKDLKLGVFCTAPAIAKPSSNVICEIIGTAVLVFGVLSLVSIGTGLLSAEGAELATAGLQESMVASLGSYITPMLVGILVFSIGLSLGGPTGYAINPARDLGPRIAHAFLPIAGKRDSNWGYAWIPVVSPIIGGVIGAWLFVLCGF